MDLKIYDKSISEMEDILDSKIVKSEDIVKEYFRAFKEKDLEKAFVSLFYQEAIERAREIDEKREKGIKLGKLAGLPLVITDDISTKGHLTTAGSKMLENYISPYNASVFEKLIREDAVILGKLRVNEFNLKALDLQRDVLDYLPIILACEIKGHDFSIKPSYGLVSRYGIVSATSSLGGISISAKKLEDLARVLEVIGGYDEKDSASAKIEVLDYSIKSPAHARTLKIYMPKEIFESLEAGNNLIKGLADFGHEVEGVDFQNLKYTSPAYKILFSGEFASNAGRYDGIGFGYRADDYKDREDLYKKSRSQALGKEAKKTIMFGNYVISSEGYDKYYKKSQKIRTLIKEELDMILDDNKFLFIPLINSLDKKARDNYHSLANMTGHPLITMKYRNDLNEEIDILIISTSFKEKDLFQLAYLLEGKLMGRGENNG